jgi:hypothetical protein
MSQVYTRRPNWAQAFTLVTVLWLLAFIAVLAVPILGRSANLADDLTRWTIRVALVYYAAAAAAMLCLDRRDWQQLMTATRFARLLWTLAWAGYLVHLMMAFGPYHHGSHAAAVRHTQEVTGFGNGIYVSHFFTLLWTFDVAWWWAKPAAYGCRPAAVHWGVHAFIAFVTFCGMVVYETGFIRGAGLAMFAFLAAVAVRRWVWLRRQPRIGKGNISPELRVATE